MTTRFYTHEACLAHDTGAHHPERASRLQAILDIFNDKAFAALERRVPQPATVDHIALMHPVHWVEAVLDAIPASGQGSLDADTVVSGGSREASLVAVGALIEAVDSVVEGAARNAFCAVRPPGHHAEQTRAMGFCLFNSVAVGAAHARAAHGLHRVAVVDFDVHHGNGTQAMLWNEEGMFYASTHQYPHYPGTGREDETGRWNNIINAPLRPGAESKDFRAAIDDRLVPALDRFQPEILFISAGFDAHERDPLASINLVEEDFAWVTERLLDVARVHAGGRVVSTLEGGYDLEALAASAARHVGKLMEGE